MADTLLTMNRVKSSASSKFGSTEKSEQTSSQSKDGVERRRIQMELIQNVFLIWLDENIDENNAECLDTISHFRRVINAVNTFIDSDQCIEFLEHIDNEKACMVISGSLAQHIVPRVHRMPQVDSIFIFCANKRRHEQWAKEWSKIKGVFTDIYTTCEALMVSAQNCEQNSISTSFLSTNDDVSKKNLNQIDSSFIYTQILKEIILESKFEEKHIIKFADYCRSILSDNENELKNIDKLQQNYRDETPVWWFTYECFLYPMLNRALRVMDFDIIIKMGFYISDLHHQIEQLHKEKLNDQNSSNSFTVYRGQGMSKADFKQMTKYNGGLIVFNNFLSATINRNTSLLAAEMNQSNPDLVGVIFILTIDPSTSSTPFASINRVRDFEVEEEILFPMQTVFRISEIKPMEGNHHLAQVELTLISANDKNLCTITSRIQQETFPDAKGWYRIGLMLHRTGRFEQAQHVYEIQLTQTVDEKEKILIYYQMGRIKEEHEEYKEAIAFYEKKLEIEQKILLPNDPELASSYNTIGTMYGKISQYEKALLSYERALAIRQKILSSNHPDLAISYNNIGTMYEHIGEYAKALTSHEKALEIKQQLLPSSHPDLAMSFNNIGNVHESMGQYSEALLCHEQALEIRQQSLPSNHSDLAISYNNIGNVYSSMGQHEKALLSHEKALEIKERSLPPNHPDLASSYGNIGNVYYNMGEYAKALTYYDKSHEIFEKTLPPNHPRLGSSYDNIGLVYENMGDYPKSRLFYKRAMNIAQRSLPSNHPNLQKSKKNLDRIEQKL